MTIGQQPLTPGNRRHDPEATLGRNTSRGAQARTGGAIGAHHSARVSSTGVIQFDGLSIIVGRRHKNTTATLYWQGDRVVAMIDDTIVRTLYTRQDQALPEAVLEVRGHDGRRRAASNLM